MKKLFYILIAVLLIQTSIVAQTTTRNFVKSTTFQTGTTTGTVLNDEKIEVITYFDGLGRPLQRIAKQGGGSKQDIITPYGYDYFGRQKREYLPYARTASSLDIETSLIPDYYGDIYALSSFYASKFPDDFAGIHPSMTTPFSEKYAEASPLSRIRKQSAPGAAWELNKFIDSDHTIKFDYYANSTTDNVKRFKVSFTNGNKEVPYLENAGTYADLQLHKTIMKNENWTSGKNNTTEEFKNKEGNIILKRTYSDYKDNNGLLLSSQAPHDTYYVYDQYGNLTFVLPPKAEGAFTEAVLNNLCYQYKYDNRNRLVEKKLPGKEWEYIVYDKLDRPILTQDANLRALKKWMFTKYDAFSRPVYTGEYVNTTQITRAAVQGLANAAGILFESRLTSPIAINGTNVYYSKSAFPDAGIDLLTINYYDNYTTIDLDGGTTVTSYNVTPVTNAKGLMTCSKVRILGTSLWTTNVIYYDAKGRSIYTYSKNNFLGTVNTIKNNIDFAGKILESTTAHQKTSAPNIIIVDTFTYDHMGRILTQKQKINSQVQETIISNQYDNLGQLVSKIVGGVQTVKYNYNVRGWLKNINDINNMGTSLFAFKINYNTPTAGTSLFNGNISQTFWKTAHTDTSLRSYLYSYDALNRLTEAKDNLDRYTEKPMYDKNGNILKMFRNGNTILNTANYGIIDNLVYTYDSGNKLQKVEDSSNNAQGFDNGTSGSNIDYSYDFNGNMLTDANKGITAISYNYLNLPVQVTIQGKTINYTYDAAGAKQRKVVNGITTDYVGGFQYENNNLQFFPQPEGYVRNNSGVYEYIYQYKDHLGNIRLSYNKSLKIIEENNYYPLGLKQMSNINTVNTVGNATAQKYKYNGKELQDELGLNFYDYGARNYDAALGRWMNIDPLSEMSRRWTPYNYAYNNPVLFVDPDGMKPQAGQSGTYYDWDEGGYRTENGENASYEDAIANHSSDPPAGVDARNGQKYTDATGSWIYDKKTTTWVGRYGNKNGKKSKNIPNTIELENINVKGYKCNYVPSGEYGPYTPDGLGITLSGSVDYNFTTYSVAFSLVADERGKIGGFLTFGSGLSTSRFDGGFGTSFDVYDTQGGIKLFDGLKGYSRGGGASYNYLGFSHYQGLDPNEAGQFIINKNEGVITNSLLINFTPSKGVNYGITNTKRLF
ncbi:DUF6443 domain-containing protein [Flavobacterium panici]|uniref:DUF6443 domain-containing protein n=1 Tax=Flavobacterium panici TaxID=2654843 RepID=A0A9N8J0K4_9FLAO|nr:DUF6443 domain-containing protein [Flavobacterium panici]CAC9974020.1 hypothetical protein FLAPXU55_01713 [Flavobacterium panici]